MIAVLKAMLRNGFRHTINIVELAKLAAVLNIGLSTRVHAADKAIKTVCTTLSKTVSNPRAVQCNADATRRAADSTHCDEKDNKR
mmetsp:Transcript_22720/g.63422  ORF Transcript_22720/g.63422 Transcript_22720/m.63422 type:complete len:85 (+) Transcript_22720:315-569(+)